MSTLIFLGATFAIMWFVLIAPQQRQVKQHRAMLATLKKGDEVLTQGGLIGKIYTLTERTVTLEISSGVRVRVEKSAIQRLWKGEDEGSATKSEEKKEEKKEEK